MASGTDIQSDSPVRMMYDSEVVWCENENGIKYVKHRYRDLHETAELCSEDELKELRWVKLSAVNVRESLAIRKFS